MAVVGVSQGDGSLSSLVPGHRVLLVEKAECKTRGVSAAAQLCLMAVFLLEMPLFPPSTTGKREVCGDQK